MLHEHVRTDPGGRPMLVAETLATWPTTGSLAGFLSAHRRLPLLVSEALKEHVLAIELSAAIMAFPAMLRDLGARLAWSDAAKRLSVLIGRFPCALHSLPVLSELLDGEAESTKYDTACLLLHSQLPKATPPFACGASTARPPHCRRELRPQRPHGGSAHRRHGRARRA